MSESTKKLVIKNLGPIKNCEIVLTKMMVFDGPQVSGKSTIAKAILFFRTVKDELVASIINNHTDVLLSVRARLLEKFTATFGAYQDIITTHSPYILGALNNLIDAQRLKSNRFDISKLLKNENLSEDYLIERQNFSAYFVENGEVQDAMDIENGLIRNEMIDDASDKINAFADALFEIERGGKF